MYVFDRVYIDLIQCHINAVYNYQIIVELQVILSTSYVLKLALAYYNECN